jgi:Fe-S-cluster containining protein
MSAPDSCKRCGSCCEKGGPSLHGDDRPLVDEGRIAARSLFTIRRGELVRENIKGALTSLAQELIKIKGQGAGWTCLFYDRQVRGCGIYDYRPLECRVLNCRDTRRIRAVYDTNRLSRQDLLSGVEGLWEMIQTHEQRCSYEAISALLAEGSSGQKVKRQSEILEIIRFDTHLRRLTVEKAGLDIRLLDFIYGRPLTDTIKMFNLKLVRQHGAYSLALESGWSQEGPTF